MSAVLKLIDITRELFDYLVSFRRRVSQASAPSLDIVQHEIEMVFYSIEKKIASQPDLRKEYQQVKYPLVVLADEILLTSPWTHAKQWEQCLLEKRYFSSNIGGNRFFKLLAQVEQMPQSVVTVFFYCLAFGFRGGFAQNDPSLLRLKGRLLQRILPAKRAEDPVLLRQAYRVETQGTGRLARVWKWRHVLIAASVVFVTLLAFERLVVWPLIMGQSLETALGTESDTAGSPSAVPAAATESKYTVQLGLFSSETLAKHFSNQIELQGIAAKIYYTDGGQSAKRYLVLSGTFDNSGEAMQLVEKARKASTLVSEMAVLKWDQVTGDCIQGCQ